MNVRRTREKGKYEGREKAIAQDRKVHFSSLHFSSVHFISDHFSSTKLVNKEFI